MTEPNSNTQSLQTAPVKERFSIAIQSDVYQKLIKNTLSDPKRIMNFTAAISSVVATNESLQECDFKTVLNAALLGEALKLAPSPQLGYYYMVPMKERKWNPQTKTREVVRIVATFILGYKGYIQLAIRSGFYLRINVIPVKKGELVSWNPFNEEFKVNPITDGFKREGEETIGYYAFFEYLNGFKKEMFWSYDQMLTHANKYSEAFSAESYKLYKEGKTDPKDAYKYSSFWYQNFDDMAMKTLLRQLLSKWGIMSVEMQNAYENDAAFQDENGKPVYPDNPPTPQNVVETITKEVAEGAGSVPIPEDKPASKPNPEPAKPHNVDQPKPGIIVDQQTGEVKASPTDEEAAAKLATMDDGDKITVKKNF
ncbi:MAG: recombinase RecT [Candidatus Izemoplasmatales bacterium]|jgi:recombination protein RecT